MSATGRETGSNLVSVMRIALLLACLLAAASRLFARPPQDEPEYPLGKLRFPSLVEPARPFRLVDLRYRVSETDSTIQSLEARLKVGSFGFLGGEVVDQRRGLFLETQRFEVGFTEEKGRNEIEAGYRAARFLARVRAERRPEFEGAGWVIDSGLGVRLSPDLELDLGYLDDTDGSSPRPLPEHPLRRGSLGFVYQRGNHLEIHGRALRSRLLTEGGIELDRDRLEAAIALNESRIEVGSRVAYEATRGRLARKETFATVDVAFQVESHIVIHGSSFSRWEPGVKRFEHGLGGGVAVYGRRFTFARGGRAAEKALALARLACDLGYNERRVYDLDGLRAMRERLSISPSRHELQALLDDLYRAEVEDRNVPQAGFAFDRRKDTVEGVTRVTYRGFIAILWPPTWPFRRSEDYVEFLRFDFGHLEERFESGLRAVSRDMTIEAALTREMSLRFRLSAPGRTPLEIAQLKSRPRRFDLEYVYAFGR